MRRLTSLLLCAVACSTRPPARTGSGPECNGQLTYIVRNGSNVDVDIITSSSTGASQAIGTVRAGSNEEFMLPHGSTTAYWKYATEGGTVRPRGKVDTRYSCRP